MDTSITPQRGRSGDGSSQGWMRGRPRRARNPFWLVVGWLFLVPVLAVLVLRWQGAARPLTIAIAGLTALFVVPLVAAAVAAWLSRSSTLRVIAAATAIVFVATVSPVDAVIGCGAEQADDAITIYSHNVFFHGGRGDDIAAAVAAEDPDVLVLQEVRWPFLQEITNDPRLAGLVHRSEQLPDGNHWADNVIWSRWPIVDVDVQRFVVSNIVTATIDGPTGPFTVSNVHTLAPAEPENVQTWLAQFDQLRTVPTSNPWLLAGDFNATTDHRPFRQLLGSGWRDVHDEKGCGFDATWPVDRGLPAPILRLDHVLVTEHFDVLDVRLGEPGGSDHLPLITSVRLTAG